MLRPTDRILGPVRGGPLAAKDALDRTYPAGVYDDAYIAAEEYIEETYRLAPLVGIDPAIVVAQSAHETANWTSFWWRERLNPAGIGITGDPKQNAASGTWANGTDAARAQIVHLWVYVNGTPFPGPLSDSTHLDPRWSAIIAAGWSGTVRTIADLTGKWAEDDDYHTKIAAKGNAIFGPGLPDQAKEHPIMARPTILVVAGHRSYGDAGNPAEKALTPALARDYRDALRRSGYTVTWLQEADGDTDPDDTVGGLDTVGSKAAFWASRTPGPILMLDLHYEGSPARGCFAIVPDVTGLRTAVSALQPANDTWEANTLDLSLARAWAQQMQAHTGLPLRQGIREPGVMDESQTGVGGQGYRLAMFAYTAPYRDRLVRLVLEHGNHTHPEDRKIIIRDDFTQKCAAAAVAAINAIYELSGTTPQPEPEPEPEPAPTPTLLPLPDGMSWELVKRRFGHYVAPWNGHVFAFDPDRAYAQVWFNRGVRSIPAGKPYWYGSWPSLDLVIRRSGGRLEYAWSDGSSYLSTPNQPEAKEAA